MRLGKRERAELALKETVKRAQRQRAAAVQDNGGKYVSSCTRLIRADTLPVPRKWGYDGRKARQVAANSGRLVA